MNKYSLMAKLPRVGERRLEYMTILRENRKDAPPEPCIVTEVNRAHLWYRVRFDSTGFHECYKLPRPKPIRWEGGAR